MKSSSAFSGWEMAQVFSANQPVIAGTTLFRQDSQPQSAAFIETGWVKIVRLEQDETNTPGIEISPAYSFI